MIVIITAVSDAKDATMIIIIKSWETGNTERVSRNYFSKK